MRKNRYYDGPTSDHFNGRFFNIAPETRDKTFADIRQWRKTSQRARWPAHVPVQTTVPAQRVTGTRITLVGHATALIQTGGLNLLTDPVWSDRCSPVQFAGPKRVCAPGVRFDDLPPIDAVLLSHNHYDHLDAATIRRLVARHDPLIITPLGNDTLVRRAARRARIVTGDWWDSHTLPGATVTFVPAQHWSARGITDARMALWCGFHVRAGDHSVYFAGDTGYGDGSLFTTMRARLGSPDVALLPIGAYAPRWFMADQHTDPAEAVRIMQDLGATRAIGIHWGVFPLSDEGRDDPVRALAHALAETGIAPSRFRHDEPGGVVDIGV
ncbi:MBL fold metallo-hydrolase [Novosphingobium sp.]|uniref:MBL fold metallo-hydrolase n=1 Tax=Novosphingobium sp. TaxID=1874826 RepID=UPI0033403CC7